MVRFVGAPALIATAVVVPLLVLGLATRVEDGRPSTSGYYPGVVLLFVLMWLSAFGFVAVFRALVRDTATGGYAAAHLDRVALREVLLLFSPSRSWLFSPTSSVVSSGFLTATDPA